MILSREKVASWHRTRELEPIFAVDVMCEYFDCHVASANIRLARLVFKSGPSKFKVEDIGSLLATNPAHNFGCQIERSVGAKAINFCCDWFRFLSCIAPKPNWFLRILEVENLNTIDQHRSSVPVYYTKARAASVASFSLWFNRWVTVAKDKRCLFSLLSKLTSSKSYSHYGGDQSNPSAQCAEPALQTTAIPCAGNERREVRQESDGERHETKHRNGAAANIKRSLMHRQYLNRCPGQKAHRTRLWQGTAA